MNKLSWMKTVFDTLFKRLPSVLPGLDRGFCIGLEMGPDRLNLVQMELVAGRPAIRAIASLPYPCPRDELHPKQLKSLLKLACATQPFKGRRVVSCLPASQIKLITVSYKEGQPDAVAIVAELRERLQGELDNLVVDFMTLRQHDAGSGRRDALVAMAPRDKVVAYLDFLTEAGLQVEALDIGPAALARLVSHAGALRTPDFPFLPNALLINFGADSSYLTVIWGRRLMLDRTVEFCENNLFNRLKKVLDMPHDLAVRLLYGKNSALDDPDGAVRMIAEVLRPEIALLLQEINKTLVYMASRTHGKSLDMIYLAGRVAPGVMNALMEQMKMPVHILNPVEVFSPETGRLDHESIGDVTGIALSAGLALRGVPEHE